MVSTFGSTAWPGNLFPLMSVARQMTATVRHIPSAERTHWWDESLESRQSFPAHGNFNLVDYAHGLLLVHNEDLVAPKSGFDRHHHKDMEIVTWVLAGTVEHEDSFGNRGTLRAEMVQAMSAGTGILHSERNPATRESRQELHVVQMWLPPDQLGVTPRYEDVDLAGQIPTGTLTVVASGMPQHAGSGVTIGNSHAALYVARLDRGQSVTVPNAPYGHVFVTRGAIEFEGVGTVRQGDAVRLTDTGGQSISADQSAEVLIWEMHARAS